MAQLFEFIGNHMFLSVAFSGLFVYLLYSEYVNRTSGIGSLSPLEATQMLNHSHAAMLDIRESKELTEGTIINAIHIPLGDLNNQLAKLEKYREKPLIVYCRSGHRSATACSKLRKQGFEKVYNLRGGIVAWQRDNLPLVK